MSGVAGRAGAASAMASDQGRRPVPAPPLPSLARQAGQERRWLAGDEPIDEELRLINRQTKGGPVKQILGRRREARSPNGSRRRTCCRILAVR